MIDLEVNKGQDVEEDNGGATQTDDENAATAYQLAVASEIQDLNIGLEEDEKIR